FSAILKTHGTQLLTIESDQSALDLFVSTLGPASRLDDAARTLGVKALSVKASNELMIPQLMNAVQRLMGALAAWQFAANTRYMVQEDRVDTAMPPANKWLLLQDSMWAKSYHALAEATTTLNEPPTAQNSVSTVRELISNRAAELETTAIQAVYQEWDR